MNDQLIFENYLLILKSTVEVYIHGTLESSNEIVRSTLKKSLNEIIDRQAKTYNIMQENNWYNTNNVNCDEIVKLLTKVENQN